MAQTNSLSDIDTLWSQIGVILFLAIAIALRSTAMSGHRPDPAKHSVDVPKPAVQSETKSITREH